MPSTTNPLRYPGAKRSLVNYIDQLLSVNHLYGCVFYEPYAGSAAVGLELLQRNRINRLILCEKDILLYAFWTAVFQHTEALCQLIAITDITIETWYQKLRYREMTSLEQAPLVELAFAGLFFNRTNFSGILKANPIGGINQTSQYDISCRFNREKIIAVIRKLSAFRDRVEVHNQDALQFMKTQTTQFLRQQCFAYFDPPYYEKGSKLYRHYYTNQDHLALSQYVSTVHHLDWMISYDDAPFICNLYGKTGSRYRTFFLDYSCASTVRTRGQELLISNLELPPVSVGAASNA